jgi:hypothetical protein
VPVDKTPFSEAHLRDLLAETPSILPVRHFDRVFAGPVSLGTEFPVPRVGRIDALFLSPTGYLTITETKLWRNPEARRKVVAQVIDYAQRLTKWSYRDLESAFQERRAATGEAAISLFDHVCGASDEAVEEAEFVDSVNRCLRDGRFLLLVVGDGIREGVEDMAEALQQTPTLRYTLGLVELACYERPDAGGGLLFVPHVVAKTKEITRAVVRIDVRHGDTDAVTVSAEVPSEVPSERPRRAGPLSEEEFYVFLGRSASPDSARRVGQFVDVILEDDEFVEVWFSPNRMRLMVDKPGEDGARFAVLDVSKEGKVRTVKACLDYLSANFGSEVLEGFISDLGAIDERLLPRRKPSGAFTVPKGPNAADLVTIAPRLNELAAVVSKLIHTIWAGSEGETA